MRFVTHRSPGVISSVPPDDPPLVAGAIAFPDEIELSWYVLHIAPPPAEERIGDELRKIGLEYHHFTELRKHPKKKPIRVATFPGYLFVRFDVFGLRWPRVYMMTGVIDVLGSEIGIPSALPDGVMDQLLSDHRERTIEADREWTPPWNKGDELKILGGAFAGFPAQYIGYQSKRIHAIVQIFGRGSLVKIERKDLEG